MKKILTITLLVALVLCIATTVKAATPSQELYNYISGTFTIAGQEVKLLNNKYLVTVEQYLTNHEISDAQKTSVEGHIKQVVSIMNKEGVTNIFELSDEEFEKAKTEIKGAAEDLEITIDYDPSTGMVIVKDESGEEIEIPASDISNVVAASKNSSSTKPNTSTTTTTVTDSNGNEKEVPVAIPIGSTNLVQTDEVSYEYLIIPVVAIIAIAMFIVYKKLEENV